MTRRRGTLVDVVVVVGVMAVVLSIFDDTFADRSYLVAGLVPVVLLVSVALVARRVAEGGWWYFLTALVLFPPVGAVVALREPGPFLAPTLDSMTQVLVQGVTAPTTLVSTVPPVDPSGQVVLVPFLIGYLATAAAAWLALGTPRPVAPVLPLLLALGATIPLGVLVPTLLVPRGMLVGLVLLAWAAHRARQGEVVLAGSRGSLAAALTMVLTIASVSGAVAVLVPDDDESDRVLLSGEGNGLLVDSAAGFPLPFEPGRDDTRLLRATGVPDGRRLRLAVLDRYDDGAGWVAAEQSPGSGGFGTYKRIGREVAALHPGTTTVVRVRFLPGYSSDWLPMLGELTSLDFDWNPGRTEVGDVRYNQATSTALVMGGVDSRDEYAFESVPGKDTLPRRGATREPTDEQRQPAGAFLDPYLESFDQRGLLPLEKVLLLARYLSVTGTVRRTDAFDQSADTLGRRMLGSRRPTGSSFQFTALMALSASRLGVAARMVIGAEPSPRGLVDYGDVTSWVELQMADGTWRPLKLERYAGSYVSGDSTQPDPPELDDFVQQQLEMAAKGGDDDIRPPRTRFDADGSPVDSGPVAREVVVTVAGGALSVVLVTLLLMPLVKTLRRRRRRTAGGWSGPFVNGWQEVLDAARDRGTPVPDTWSRFAQATRLGAGCDLAQQADAAVFAPGQAQAADAAEFWRACDGVRRALLAEVGVRRRLWARITPASVLAGWARGRRGRAPRAPQVTAEDV